MKIRSMLFIVACFINLATFAQQGDKKKFIYSLDSFTNRVMERIPDIPAISVTLVNDKGAIFNKAYGWANKEAGIKADVNTAFYIASSTKSFTALAAGLLDHERKIFLDSPVTKYFKDLRFVAEIGNDVTIRSLLNHTSGLENGPLTFRMAYTGAVNRNDMLNVLANATSVKVKPGTYRYDNLGYNIYALALQETLQLKWQDLLQDKIFTPLGMKRTTAYMSAAKKNNWTVALPYYAYGPNGLERLYLEKTDNTMQSAGGLITTPSDIAVWLQAQITGGKINNKQVFPAEVMDAVHTGSASFDRGSGLFSAGGKYGLGWLISQYHDQKIIYHYGGFPGYRAHISFMPDKNTGLAIFVNEGSVGAAAAEMIAGYIYDWVTGINVQELYRNKIDELESNHKKGIEASQRTYADRAKRTSQLSMPLQSYAGKYKHPYMGEMDISVENNTLSVKMGHLHVLSTPFTQKESIRVELIPGTGQVIFFKANEKGEVQSLQYDGMEYKRVL